MSNLNLNNPTDFATATLSGVSSLLNQLTGLSQQKWDIQESSYGTDPNNEVKFHIFKSAVDYSGAVDQVQDKLSRRVAEFSFPYVEGQTTEDLGGDGNSYDFDILIHGPNYYKAYTALLVQFNSALPGTLVHPILGRVTVKYKNALVTHKSSARQAVALRVTFVSHDFDVSFASPVPTVKSTLSLAVAFISKLNTAVTKIQSNILTATIVKNALVATVNSFNTSYTSLLVTLNTTFNAGSSADIPSLLPNNTAVGLNQVAYPTGSNPNDAFAGLTPAQIQAKQSAVVSPSQATGLVAALWTQANAAISDIESANDGQGALDFYDQTVTIRQAALAMQSTLVLCLQSSKSVLINYTTPRLMSIREVCFENGLTPDDSEEILTLNPSLLSVNDIPAQTVVQVPSV